MALQSVAVNKLRTLLSLLGITIGIFAIISVFTIVDSLERYIRDSIDAFGTNIVYIERWPWTDEGGEYQWWKYASRPRATFNEFQEIPSMMPGKIESIAIVMQSNRTVRYEKESIENIGVIGATYDYKEMRKTDIGQGRFFSPIEAAGGANLAIIGSTVASELFLGEDPIGKLITIRGKKLEVIGVFTKEGSNSFGLSWDEQVLVPYEFFKTIANMRWTEPFITIKCARGVNFDDFKAELASVMRRLRRLNFQAEDNFAINEISAIGRQFDTLFGIINLAGGIIGMFSILVGGFGVANIMFVSVKERTTQIGIQKALGAKPYMIMLQFVFEAVLLAVVGGIIGLLLIYVGTIIASNISEFTITLTIKNIALGLGISSLIGLVSGIFPAYTAATMEPVKAIYKT